MKKNKVLSKQFLEKIDETFTISGKDLIFEFFVTFSRFEYALKSNSFFTVNATPDWDKFVNSIKEKFDRTISEEINNAVEFLIQNPPRIQYVDSGLVAWNDRIIDKNTPLLNRLRLHICDIRNNLFHGGKFDGDFEPEISRNYELINSALLILNNWLTLNNQLRRDFIDRFPK